MSSQEQQRVSVADLLASSVFHLLSRQCDPAMKPKNCLSISPFSNSNSVTRSFRSFSFVSYQSSYIYYGKSQQLQTLLHSSALHPLSPLHNPKRASRVQFYQWTPTLHSGAHPRQFIETDEHTMLIHKILKALPVISSSVQRHGITILDKYIIPSKRS